MDEASESFEDLVVVGLDDRRCRALSKRREHALDAAPYGHRVAERKARRYQSNDFPVDWLVIVMDEVHGILPAPQR